MFRSLLIVVLIGHAVCSNEVQSHLLASATNLKAMESVFMRSEKVHTESMATISKGLSMNKAMSFLTAKNITSQSFEQVTDAIMGKKSSHLRQPTGYSGIDGARKLLNDMIYESMSKYDGEIAKCTEYYSTQCTQMEACRSQIAASNYIAANSRSLILDAQAIISRCEVDIPTTKLNLKQHLLKCKHENKKLNDRLKIVLGDIAVMTTILEMTDCEKSFSQQEQLALLHCKDECSKENFVTFEHDVLQKKVSQLQTTVSKQLFKQTLADMFEGVAAMEGETQMVHVSGNIPNKTEFNNPPVPVTGDPGNPCTDPAMGAPSAATKRAAKCTIKKSPQCYKLQERFLLIQSGIEDERDDLKSEIDSLEKHCEETKQTLEKTISDDEDALSNSQTNLASATTKEATAAETARQTAATHEQLDGDLVKQMKSCNDNYINYETEICALKKIRGELYKMKGGGHSAFFQDCEVSKWEPEECSKSCAGGEQKVVRKVLSTPELGTACLPLEAMKNCNTQPCPVDCELETWSGWSKCSAECGGGVTQRLREVKMAMKYGGAPCGETSEAKACNGQACEKDCELTDWTTWSDCSKDCDGGTQKRQKFVKVAAEGEGKCPGKWDIPRLEYKQCNMNRCVTEEVDEPLHCNRTLDVILLLDGSGSLGKKGWEAEIKAAKYMVEAFEFDTPEEVKAQISVILYSGPKTWGGVRKCFLQGGEEVCRVKTVTHFTQDLKKVKAKITDLEWPQGSTLTSLALLRAKAELALGRADARSVVVVFTDGRPLSFRKTGTASRLVRKSARLIWVAVTKFAPLKYIKTWATRRWQENLIKVDDFDKLEDPYVVTHIVADICPMDFPGEGEFDLQ